MYVHVHIQFIQAVVSCEYSVSSTHLFFVFLLCGMIVHVHTYTCIRTALCVKCVLHVHVHMCTVYRYMYICVQYTCTCTYVYSIQVHVHMCTVYRYTYICVQYTGTRTYVYSIQVHVCVLKLKSPECVIH